MKKSYIPCLYLPYLGGSSKILIYFHGNAEDVGLAMELLAFVKDMLKVRKDSILLTFKYCRFMCLPWNTQAMACTKVSLMLIRSHWMHRTCTTTWPSCKDCLTAQSFSSEDQSALGLHRCLRHFASQVPCFSWARSCQLGTLCEKKLATHSSTW